MNFEDFVRGLGEITTVVIEMTAAVDLQDRPEVKTFKRTLRYCIHEMLMQNILRCETSINICDQQSAKFTIRLAFVDF